MESTSQLILLYADCAAGSTPIQRCLCFRIDAELLRSDADYAAVSTPPLDPFYADFGARSAPLLRPFFVDRWAESTVDCFVWTVEC